MDPNRTALIVDDEYLDVEFLTRVLTGAGFSVYSANSYDEAMQVFDEHHEEIDLLLVDVSLPGRNGVELAKDLLKRNSDLRLLFVSGHVGAEVIRFYGMQTTDRHFLEKPFTSTALLARVREIMQSSAHVPWTEADLRPDTRGDKPGAANKT
jgi:DNA-binding response OmpR family regulator